jgi:hypothetical protein
MKILIVILLNNLNINIDKNSDLVPDRTKGGVLQVKNIYNHQPLIPVFFNYQTNK